MLDRKLLRQPQAGISLVELMVSMAVGLLVLAGAATFFANYVQNSRGLLLSTRLTQEIRAVTDLIARDLRRGGYWENATQGVWFSGTTGVQGNPYAALSVAVDDSQLSYNYAQDSNNILEVNETFGFRLNNGVLQMLRNGAWADLTDSGTTTVTAFTLTPATRQIQIPCINSCTGGGSACWPTMAIRQIDIVVSAQATADSSIQREIRESVRVRNDHMSLPLGTQVCP